jgi:hypothetical protein
LVTLKEDRYPPVETFDHPNEMMVVMVLCRPPLVARVSIVGARQPIEASTALPRAHCGPSPRRALRPLVRSVVPYTGTLVIVLLVTSV